MLSKPLFWLVKSHYSIIFYLKSLVNLPCSLMNFSEIIIFLGEIHHFPGFLGWTPHFPWGKTAGPWTPRRIRGRTSSTLATRAASARCHARCCGSCGERARPRPFDQRKKRGFYSTRDSHDIPTLHGKLVYFIKIFPCKYHGPFYRYFPWYSPVIVG